MEHVFKDKEEEHLRSDGDPAWEGHLPGRHAKELSHRMEEPDDGELDGKVAEEDLLSAGPLLPGRWDLSRLELPLAEVGRRVDKDPGQGPAKVYDLQRSQDARLHRPKSRD